jgi:hypothetical protein
VLSVASQSKEEIIKETKRIGVVYNKDITGFGKKLNKEGKEVYIKGGFQGWKLREDIEEEVVPEDGEKEAK